MAAVEPARNQTQDQKLTNGYSGEKLELGRDMGDSNGTQYPSPDSNGVSGYPQGGPNNYGPYGHGPQGYPVKGPGGPGYPGPYGPGGPATTPTLNSLLQDRRYPGYEGGSPAGGPPPRGPGPPGGAPGYQNWGYGHPGYRGQVNVLFFQKNCVLNEVINTKAELLLKFVFS